ncbi:Fungal-specific transcription factor domain-containing protein, partial [Coniochaeta hoffmannii]
MPPLTLNSGPEDTEMSMGTVVGVGAKAAQACVPCRKQKRKCDKGLPACGLCSRMGRICDYTEVQQAPTAEDLMSMQMKIFELEQRLNQKEQENGRSIASPNGNSNSSGGTPGPSASFLSVVNERPPLWMPAQSKFPSAMFLDIDCFIYASLPVPKPSAEIPMDVLEILSNANALQQAVTDYFNTVHCWFPIISKKRMNMGHPLHEGGTDLAMLFLAMKLVSSPPVNGVASADSHLYVASKRFLALLESSGTISLMYLQAMILVAIYEFGHSIYPAAWMTVGACSRYAEILGLPSYKDSVVILGQLATWTELEERRRVWWGIFVLDRVICLGNKRRPVAPSPNPNDILPMNDTAWDEGDVANALQSTVSAPFSDAQGPFARLCQAAILIDRVQSHLRSTIKRHRARDPEPFSLQEVTAIVDDLTSFSSLISSELAAASASTSSPPSNSSPAQPPTSPPGAFTYPSPMHSNPTTT